MFLRVCKRFGSSVSRAWGNLAHRREKFLYLESVCVDRWNLWFFSAFDFWQNSWFFFSAAGCWNLQFPPHDHLIPFFFVQSFDEFSFLFVWRIVKIRNFFIPWLIGKILVFFSLRHDYCWMCSFFMRIDKFVLHNFEKKLIFHVIYAILHTISKAWLLTRSAENLSYFYCIVWVYITARC